MFRYLLTTLLVGLASAKIPSNITLCGRRDPNLNQCMLRSIQETLPKVIGGVPEWGLPKFEPFHIDEIEVANQERFMAKVKNADVYGLANLVMKSVNVHLDKHFLTTEMFLPEINVTGEYDGVTKILVSLVGKGPMTVVANDIEASLIIYYDVLPRKNGNQIFLTSVTAKFNIGKLKIKYESYENPGGPLDEAINTAMNADIPAIIGVITKPLETKVAELMVNIGNAFGSYHTFEQLLPDRE